MRKLLKYMTMILLLTSCEEQKDWDLQVNSNDQVVVDGIITNELKVQRLSLSMPVISLNEKPRPVSGATVLVSSNQQVYSFHEDLLLPGMYLSDKAFIGLKNRTYSLLLTSGSSVFTAKTNLEPAMEFIFLRYTKSENKKDFRITAVASQYNPHKPAMYEILLDWSEAPGYASANPDSCKAKLFYYTLPTLDVSEVLAPALEKLTFPAGTLITERRYSLTDEHAAFIRAVLLETTWQGGYFNTASSNVPTNLSAGAIGFFGACGVIEKQEIVK